LNFKIIISLVLLLYFGCSTPQPIELNPPDSSVAEIPAESADRFAVIIVNHASMFNPVAGEFLKRDSGDIARIVGVDPVPFYFLKANSFFPPPETTSSFVMYSASNNTRLPVILSYTDQLIHYLNEKYQVKLNSYQCIWFSPGRTFFRPVNILPELSVYPVFIWTNCRNQSREAGQVWEAHRVEWDQNINWLDDFHKFSLAAANAEETIPQNNNILYSPAYLFTQWDSILPCELISQDLIVIVAGSDLMSKLGF
jgi:hypothetical protein